MWSEDICLHIAFCPPTGQRTAISTGRHGHSELKRTGRRRLEGAISNQVHDLQQLLLPYILGQAAQPLYRIPVRRSMVFQCNDAVCKHIYNCSQEWSVLQQSLQATSPRSARTLEL